MDSEDWYLIKNKHDFNKMFKVQMNIKKYFNSRKNIYESVLDNSEGISKEKNYSNSTLDSLKPKELVDEYIKETKIINSQLCVVAKRCATAYDEHTAERKLI